MASIDFNFQGVLNTTSSIEQTLNETLEVIGTYKAALEDMNSIWRAKEANKFRTQFEEVYSSLEKFSQKNTDFILFLYSAVAAYQADAEGLLAAINGISVD